MTITHDNNILPAVVKAIDELRATFDQCSVEVEADGSGGASVIVRGIPLGSPYRQTNIWIGFQITCQYPYADVYPHFTDSNLARQDGTELGGGFGSAQFRDQPSIQISRRSNRLNPATDTASLKLQKVIQWLKNPK